MAYSFGFGDIEDMIAQALGRRGSNLGGTQLGMGTSRGPGFGEKLGEISSLLDLLFRIQDQKLKIGGELGSLRGLARGLGGGGVPIGFTSPFRRIF